MRRGVRMRIWGRRGPLTFAIIRLTKEPKLERARRQVPEWTVYDDEIAALARRVAGVEDAAGVEFVQSGEERKDEL